MTQWTEHQTRAIEARNCNLLVSAGAGSGKTAVLTERITRLIADERIDADRFVVLTFTKAAASEMKRRIRQQLREKARASDDAAYFHGQIQKLEKAQISTIHSFCLNLIKQYYYVIDADPSASVLNDAESLILRQEALEALFEEKYESGDEAFLALADLYSPGNDDTPLKEHIAETYEFICNRPDPWQWLQEACRIFRADASALEQSACAVYLRGHAQTMLQEAIRLCTQALTLCRDSDEDGKRTSYLQEMNDHLEAVYRAAQSSLCELFARLEAYCVPRFDIRSFCAQSEQIKTLRADAKDLYDDLKGMFGFSYETALAQLADLELPMQTFAEAVKGYADRYRELKSERSAVDYSDMEQMCLAVLRNDEAAQAVRAGFDYVFVDEYQDTNAIQEEILCRIAKKDNLFAVGDIKQSIYRFREAEPDIFLARYKAYASAEDALSELIFLTDNFRTQPGVIHALNHVFSHIMFRETGGVDYAPDEMLRPGKSTYVDVKPEVRVIELPSGMPSSEEGSQEDRQEVLESVAGMKKQEIEAAHVADLVSRLLREELYDEKEEKTRMIKPSDIAIIGRNMKSQAAFFVDALKAVGVESEGGQQENYYDETEVALTVNLLQLIDNEKNDLPLLGVMRSFLFGFDEDELLRIRVANPQFLYYHEALSAYADHGEDIALACKIRAMLLRITEYREMSKHMPIERMMRRIYSDTDILTYVGCLPNGAHRQRNLNELLKLAGQYESSSMKGLYHFIQYIEKCRQNTSASASTQTSGGDKVRIMTVHKSKGLEFEIVIMVGCGNPFLKTELKSDIVCHKSLGICPTYYDIKKFYGCDTILKTAVKARIEEENNAEEMRILYVGATRAKQRLYFVGTVRSGGAERLFGADCSSVYRIAQANTYFDWLFGGILADCGDSVPASFDADPVYETDHWRISVHHPSGIAAPADEEGMRCLSAEIAPREGSYYERLSAQLSYRYPHLLSSHIPSKLTVTEIKDSDLLAAGEKLVAMQAAPKFADDAKSQSGARIGTLVHRALMHFDFSQLSEEFGDAAIGNEIARMTDLGLFDKEEALLIDRKMLHDFFGSEIGRSLLAAKEIHRETPFLMRMPAADIDAGWSQSGESVLVQGVIDCWFRNGEQTVLLDYKTDRAWEESYYEFLREKYAKQIRLYARALQAVSGKLPDECDICFIAMDRYERVTLFPTTDD
ncbi:MAG: helicase-exonuclease AddAB subunit AddA [Anaerofustis sp.]